MRAYRLIRPALVALVAALWGAAPGMAADECLRCHEDMAKAMDTSAGFIGIPKGDAISTTCARCHSDTMRMKAFGSSLPLRQWEDLQASVHGKLSGVGAGSAIQCVTCHNAHGILRVQTPASPVSPLNLVKKCASCHSNAAFMRTFNPSLPVDQLDKYRTSVHGALNAKGDSKAAQCVSCHGSHAILRATDAKSRVNPVNLPATCATCHSNAVYMKAYGIPTDQFEKYANSVHGVALLQRHDEAAPACNDCHGNHGAAPPGVTSIANVCGTCHTLNAELFAGSPHKKVFDEQKLPECETCHGNHEVPTAEISMLGVSAETVCSTCHSESDNVRGFAAARTMRSLLDSLIAMEETARNLVDEAEQKGMEIGDAKFSLRNIRQARLETRTLLHAFSESRYRPVVEKGIVQAASVRSEAEEAIHEFYFRRIGLGASTLVITIIAICLWLLIRRIEKKGTLSDAARDG